MRPEPITPGPGQESVWDYPRPPRVEALAKRVRVIFGGVTVANTVNARRVLETSQAPAIYIPPSDVLAQYLVPDTARSFCEWKGVASYYSIVVGEHTTPQAAWAYPNPSHGYESIRDYLSFYPSRVDACYIDDELVLPMPGDFYGGWITANVVGPFKGSPGTRHW